MKKCHAGLLVLAAISTTHFGCADKSGPMTPSATVVEAKRATSGSVSALNAAPNLVVRTTPAADYSTNPPTIRVTKAPLTVFFGLCRTDDADQGDSLNWQFNFGDSGRPAFNENGTFNPDHEHECRVEHEYREGTYTAWVSVTDKHLEDQGKDVRSLARRSQPFTIIASTERECARGLSVNTGFEGTPFTPAESLGIPGVSFDSGGAGVTVPLSVLATGPVPPLSGDILFGTGFAPLEMTFESDQESYRFDGAADATALIVMGFDAAGALVFTHTFTPPPPSSCGCDPVPFPVSGSGRFKKLVVTAPPNDFWALDNLSTLAACK